MRRIVSLLFVSVSTALALSACGGGGSDAGTPAANQAPVATIVAPLSSATFRAGDTLNFSGSASDAEDGTLTGSRLTWWADLHHDTHTHPLQAQTSGGTGSMRFPTRGETSSNIYVRFHLRATDSAGAVTEVTRDVQPQRAQITLATSPAGLALTLDGQPVSASTVTGVVGLERDLGAADQNYNGRVYRFASWSDGGAANHTISTPAANTTYTATFTDAGPVANLPPAVALTGVPSTAVTGVTTTLNATASDTDGSVARVEFFDGATRLGEDTSTPFTLAWVPATTGAHSLTARATDNLGLATTSTAVTVTVSAAGVDTQAPVTTLTAPAALATGLTGTLTLSATATDNVAVTAIEIQLDGVQVGATGSSGTHSVSVATAAYAPGQHVVRARSRDAAGNTSPWVNATVQFSGSNVVPSGFTLNPRWVSDLTNAVTLTQAPDGRLLVAQQGGALRVVKDGVLLNDPMLTVAVNADGERGLLGVTLHPDFPRTAYVYVYYTAPSSGGVDVHNRVSRFTVTGDVASGEVVLVDLPPLGATNHNGGAIHFGLDGKLYVAVGDNANSELAPLLTNVFGKMLRFNADGSIPSDNPFFSTQDGQNRAIWAYGLRNPFTFAIHPTSGRMHINDVGRGSWEEINLGGPGADYGWPSTEGSTPSDLVPPPEKWTKPLFAYKHPGTRGDSGFFAGQAIAGGAFYPDTGPFPPAYRNSYYFADYVSGFVGRYDFNNAAAYAFATVPTPAERWVVDLLVGIDGSLYVLTRESAEPAKSHISRISAP